MANLSDDPYGQISSSWTQRSVTVTAAGTPVQVSTTNVFVEEVEFHARKNKTTANTGAIYLGPNNTPLRVLLPGDVSLRMQVTIQELESRPDMRSLNTTLKEVVQLIKTVGQSLDKHDKSIDTRMRQFVKAAKK